MSNPRIGFIGLGNMGGPMAKNIVKAEHPLAVFDLRNELTLALCKEGAHAAAYPKDVEEASDIISRVLRYPRPYGWEEGVFSMGQSQKVWVFWVCCA